MEMNVSQESQKSLLELIFLEVKLIFLFLTKKQQEKEKVSVLHEEQWLDEKINIACIQYTDLILTRPALLVAFNSLTFPASIYFHGLDK